jgi:hypothetical protein
VVARRAVARSVRRIGTALRGALAGGRRRAATATSSGSAGGAPRVDEPLRILYAPELDGSPDPGEVVWGWVPYEEDPTQGKDRPLVVVGRRGTRLAAVPLTSRRDDRDAQVAIGAGAWDRAGRPSYARIDRLMDLDPSAVRREGAIVPRDRFDAVAAAVIGRYRTETGPGGRVP